MKAKKMVLVFFIFMSLLTATTAVFAKEAEAPAETTTETAADEGGISMKALAAFLGAAIAFGLGAIGAGLAIGQVGAAAMGAIAEKPHLAGQALIFVALAEGVVVFGFITALMILGKV